MFRAVIVGEREDGQTLAVIEVSLMESVEKENESRYHQGEAEENENHDHFHERPFETRTAVSVTTATELAGMKMAAATGVTRPAAQQPTATTL